MANIMYGMDVMAWSERQFGVEGNVYESNTVVAYKSSQTRMEDTRLARKVLFVD